MNTDREEREAGKSSLESIMRSDSHSHANPTRTMGEHKPNKVAEWYYGIKDAIKNSSKKARIAFATLTTYAFLSLASPSVPSLNAGNDYRRGDPKPPKANCTLDAAIGAGTAIILDNVIYQLIIKPSIKKKPGETSEHYKKRLSDAYWISLGSFTAAGIAGGVTYYFTVDKPKSDKNIAEWTTAQDIDPDDANTNHPIMFSMSYGQGNSHYSAQKPENASSKKSNDEIPLPALSPAAKRELLKRMWEENVTMNPDDANKTDEITPFVPYIAINYAKKQIIIGVSRQF